MKVDYHQSYIWPLWLRLIHWAMALGVVVLATSGWLLGSGMVVNEQLRDVLLGMHLPAGQFLAAALAARLVMLFLNKGVGGWKAMQITREGARAAGEMFRFYLAFGRRQMPAFHSHDPLWKLIYPAFFLLLGIQALTGLAFQYGAMRRVLRVGSDVLDPLHSAGAWLVLWVVGLHVAAVLLREVRSQGYEVSSMLHGHRLFKVDREGPVDVQSMMAPSVSVTLDLSGKSKR